MDDFLQHYRQHVNWPFMLAVWVFLAALAWHNPHWWAAVILMIAVPPLAAAKGHMLGCVISEQAE